MKKIALFLGFSLLASLAACGDDGGTTQGTDMPALSATQVDRIGRAAIATALIEAFNPNTAMRDAAKNAYSADGDAAGWKGKYTGAAVANALGSNIVGSLAILDALGPTACDGNPIDDALDAGNALPRYAALAGVLADDQIYVNSKSTTCTQYLAVEAAAIGGVMPTDCGGRTPNYDTVDISLNVLVLGDPAATTVTDAVAQDAAKAADLGKFPFLKTPAP